jgi:hypothetical protein
MLLQRLLQTLAGMLLVVDDKDAWYHGVIDAPAFHVVNGK